MKTSSRIYTIPFSAIGEKDFSLVGGRAFRIKQIQKLGVRSPSGLVFTTLLFQEILADVLKEFYQNIRKLNVRDVKQIKNVCNKVQKSIEKVKFETQYEKLVKNTYSTFSGIHDKYVAVRASSSFENPLILSHYPTYLNIKGHQNIIEKIRRCWQSQFEPEVIINAARENMKLNEINMAVIIQQMIQAEISGDLFTVNPIDNDDSKLEINAVLGLGKVLVEKEVVPDTYVVDKKNEEIIEKHVTEQEWMLVRKGKVEKNEDPNVKVRVSKLWGKKQKISDSNINELVKIGKQFEDYFGEPQQIHWVLQGGRIWVMQSRPIEAIEIDSKEGWDVAPTAKSLMTKVGDIKEVDQFDKQEIGSAVMDQKANIGVDKMSSKSIKDDIPGHVEIAKAKEERKKQEKKKQQEEEEVVLLLTGKTGNIGEVTGKIRVIRRSEDLNLIKKGDIIVVKRVTGALEPFIPKVGAVITDEVDGNELAVKLSKMLQIPCVIGTQVGTKIFSSGEKVTVNATKGAIYEGIKKKTIEKESKESRKVKAEEKDYPDKSFSDIEEKKKEDADLSSAKSKKIEADNNKMEVDRTDIKSTIHKDKDTKKSFIAEAGNTTEVDKKPVEIGIRTATKVFINVYSPEDINIVSTKDIDGLILVSDKKVLGELCKPEKRDKESNSHEISISACLADNIYKLSKQLSSLPLVYKFSQESFLEYKVEEKIEKDLDDRNNIGSDSEKKEVENAEEKEDENQEKKTEGTKAEIADNPELNFLECELEALKNVRNKMGMNNIWILTPVVVNIDGLFKIKKVLTSWGLNRSPSLKIIQTLGTPANIHNLGNFKDGGVDGFSIDYRMLSQLMTGQTSDSVCKEEKQKVIDPVVKEAIQQVAQFCAKNKLSSFLYYENSHADQSIVNTVVESGINGISISPETLSDVRKQIKNEESNLIVKQVGRK